MKQFVESGRAALASGNMMAALFVAIGLPDICGSLIEPKARNGERYRTFAEAWLRRLVPDLITPEELYALRNSVLHAGSDEIRKTEIERFVLMDRPIGLPVVRQVPQVILGGTVPGAIIINTKQLCEIIFESVEAWSASGEGAKVLADNGHVLMTLKTEPYKSHGMWIG